MTGWDGGEGVVTTASVIGPLMATERLRIDTKPSTMKDEVRAVLREDPTMAALLDRHGPVAIEPAPDPFRRLLRSITSQQVSTASARAIRSRLFERFDVTPATLADAEEAALRDVGLSRQKAEYVRAVARAHVEGRIDRDRFEGMDDEAVMTALTEVRGIGDWTAKMYLMFCLGREDVFPVEDLGIRKGMWEAIDPELTRSAMVDHARRWAPYRSYASRLLWASQD